MKISIKALAVVAIIFASLCAAHSSAALRSKSISFDDNRDKNGEVDSLKDQLTELTNKVEILEHLVNQLLKKANGSSLPLEQPRDGLSIDGAAKEGNTAQLNTEQPPGRRNENLNNNEAVERVNKSAKDLWESQKNKIQGETAGQRGEVGYAQERMQEQASDGVRSGNAQTLEEAYERQQKKVESQPQQTQTTEGATITKDRIARPSTEKIEYDEALASLKDNKLQEAEKRFQSFISKYPKSNLQSNAYFWYAESFFKRNAFEKAAVHYLKGYKMFPKGTKAADSLLKLASCLSSLNKKSEACAILKKLDLEFPNRSGTSMKRAQDLKVKLGCD